MAAAEGHWINVTRSYQIVSDLFQGCLKTEERQTKINATYENPGWASKAPRSNGDTIFVHADAIVSIVHANACTVALMSTAMHCVKKKALLTDVMALLPYVPAIYHTHGISISLDHVQRLCPVA